MSSSERIKGALSIFGYNLYPREKYCDHAHPGKSVTIYEQECGCRDCKELPVTAVEKDLNWYYFDICHLCLTGYLSMLRCGGHYNNLWISDPLKSWEFAKYEFSPDEPLFDEEEYMDSLTPVDPIGVKRFL
jgi:hypothetical protein